MNFRRHVATAIIATMSLTAIPSFAQNHSKEDKNDKTRKVIVIKQGQSNSRNDRSDKRDDRQDSRQDSRQDRKVNNRAEHRDDQRSNKRTSSYYNARGSEFKRGHRLPSALRSKQYVVSNPQRHHLKAAPRGQQWVQVGADYVLVAVTTGLIASIVLGR